MDEAGLAIRTVEAAYSTRSPEPGWSEQAPNYGLMRWIRLLNCAHRAATNLIGIGVAGHMHGATLLDDMGNVRPCILWNDTRAAIEAASLDQILFSARFQISYFRFLRQNLLGSRNTNRKFSVKLQRFYYLQPILITT